MGQEGKHGTGQSRKISAFREHGRLMMRSLGLGKLWGKARSMRRVEKEISTTGQGIISMVIRGQLMNSYGSTGAGMGDNMEEVMRRSLGIGRYE